MRTKFGNMIWGLAFIFCGIGFAGNIIGFWDFSLFFDGWWTLFIIIPSIVSIIKYGIKISNGIAITIGVLLLLSAQDIIDGYVFSRLIFPAILVIIGLKIIFRDNFNKEIQKILQIKQDGLPDYTAVFSATNHQFINQMFEGATISSIFAGVDFDLRGAIITQDVVINATAVFGGIDILVSPNVKVKVSSTPIFGGTSNGTIPSADPNAPTIFINSVCVFGGIEIK